MESIEGKVLTLGKQKILYTLEQVLKILRSEDFIVDENIIESLTVQEDKNTRAGDNSGYMDDKTFFKLFCIENVESMDISDYEGADIIHDINIALKNVTKLLKSNGRAFMWNAVNNFLGCGTYCSLEPWLFFLLFCC